MEAKAQKIKGKAGKCGLKPKKWMPEMRRKSYRKKKRENNITRSPAEKSVRFWKFKEDAEDSEQTNAH